MPESTGDRVEFAFGVLVVLILPLIGLGLFALWIYALVDAIRTPEHAFRTGTQLVWVIVILLGNIVGAIIYLVMGRPARA
jgi:predicted Co/Zn/Cd cation transporter (cation efflux family)